MKKYITVFLLWLTCWCAMAQQLSVSSFKCMPTDLDARVDFPVRDHNGKTCALIKVENINTGFEFYTGTLSVQKVEQKTGEIWVYVQPGVRKMTIKHQSLGILRDYLFPEPIKEATVYVMKLESGSVTTIVTNTIKTGYLIVESNPSDAEVWIDNEWLGNTPFSKKYPIGTKVQYNIKKQLYHNKVGTATVTDTQTKLQATLKPAFGTLHINSTPSGAVVYLDDDTQAAGTTPLTLSQVASGSHRIRLQKAMYESAKKEVVVTDGVSENVNVTLSPRFATLTINSLPGAKIMVDSKEVGTGAAVITQSEGICDLVATLPGHRDAKQQLTVVVGQNQTIALNPTPIYGSLAVESNPMGATIYVDGKSFGTTPNVIPNLLVGTHSVRISKAGCTDYRQEVMISENQEFVCNATLQTGKSVRITSDRSGEDVYIDGVKMGTTPLTITLSFGEHQIYAVRNGEKSSEQTVNVKTNMIEDIVLSFGKMNFTVNGVTFSMVKVDGGTFRMGGTAEQGSDAYNNEKPVHNVTLSPYYIGSTEVTQALWQAVMGNNPSHYKGDNRPVESVSWNDCQEFIKKLNSLTGRTFRLPTEAEWEYAARGGNRSKGYKYSGSNKLSEVAWYTDNSRATTHQVAGKIPNELGLYDMSGNVWEWCSDWYGSYSSTSQTDPKGSSNCSRRVSRGGSWNYNAMYCRVSYRDHYTPDYILYDLGLRLCLSPVR